MSLPHLLSSMPDSMPTLLSILMLSDIFCYASVCFVLHTYIPMVYAITTNGIHFPYFSVSNKTDRLLHTPNLSYNVMTFCVLVSLVFFFPFLRFAVVMQQNLISKNILHKHTILASYIPTLSISGLLRSLVLILQTLSI